MKTSSAILTRTLVDTAVKLGVDREELLGRVGLTSEMLNNPETRVPDGTHPKLIKEAMALSGDELVCLKVGEWYQPDPTDHMSNLVLNSTSVRTAAENAAQFYHFLTDESYLEFLETPDVARLVLRSTEPGALFDRTIAEWTLSVWARMVRLLAGKDFQFSAVGFQHSEIQFGAAYACFFGGKAHFGQQSNELVFPAQALDIPNPLARPTIFRMAEKLAQEKLVQLGGAEDGIVLQVKKELLKMLQGVPPDQKRIATDLGMDPRTLQRQLKTHGVSYRLLLDEMRREYALKLIQGGDFSITDISFLMGYNNPSNFYREFSRWHGAPPGKFKNL